MEALGGIGTVVGRINDTQSAIAAAVEQQTATTTEMSRSLTGAAFGSRQIAEHTASMAASVAATADGATTTHQAATELSRMARELHELLDAFKE